MSIVERETIDALADELDRQPWVPDGLTFRVGDRVRIRLSGECELHNQSRYPLKVDGLVGTIIADTRVPGSVHQHNPTDAERWKVQGHYWFVRFDQPVGRWKGQRINCEDFSPTELIPLDPRHGSMVEDHDAR